MRCVSARHALDLQRAAAIRASCGRYQFQRPRSFIALGSTIERMIVASISSATATPKPICWNMIRSPIAKPRNTATMINAAPVMIRAVEATPCTTASDRCQPRDSS